MKTIIKIFIVPTIVLVSLSARSAQITAGTDQPDQKAALMQLIGQLREYELTNEDYGGYRADGITPEFNREGQLYKLLSQSSALMAYPAGQYEVLEIQFIASIWAKYMEYLKKFPLTNSPAT